MGSSYGTFFLGFYDIFFKVSYEININKDIFQNYLYSGGNR